MSGNRDGNDPGSSGEGSAVCQPLRLQHASDEPGARLTWSSSGRSHGPVEGTNVVRVPFGVRRARRVRPERPDHWATLVLPFQQAGGDPTPPPQAA